MLEAHARALEVVVAWQGSEPTITGAGFVRGSVQLERGYASPGRRVLNTLPTNGMLIDDEFEAFVLENEFLVAISIDGPREIHDRMKIKHEPTPVVMRSAHVRVRREPLGVTLIIGAWNEPYMLTVGPLVPAVAAGNTAVIKPSEIAQASAEVLAEIVPKYLDTDAFAVVQGGMPETTELLAQKWDMIFFTGSPPVGKIVHQAAAQHVTPAVLELVGKNPTIVHSSADVRTAARRIAFGRYANSGHICTAPDHVLVWPEVGDELVAQLREAIHDFYGDEPKQSPDYGRVINQRNFDRLAAFLDNGTVAVGARATLSSSTSRRPCSSTSRSTDRSCRTRSSVRSCRCSRSTRSRL